jgi:ATP-binding cassette, subfamily C (CFTR/MRP), member 1
VKYNNFNDVAMIGISLNYTYVLPYFLGIYSGFIMSMTYLFTSLERFAEYASDKMPQEPTWKLEKDPDSTMWPSKGEVRFQNVSMRYRKNLPLALKNVNFTIDAGLRVAVVGRTGAGKSSLVSLLFRLTDTAEGNVYLDGRRHDSVGLHTLRQSVFVLPQTPLLFPGSVAHNLDPFHRKSSKELLSVRTLSLLPTHNCFSLCPIRSQFCTHKQQRNLTNT